MRSTLVLFFLVIPAILTGQKKPKNYYLKPGFLYSLNTIKDDGLSPVAYFGKMTGGNVDIIERTKTYDDILSLSFVKGVLTPPFENTTQADSWQIVIDWHHDFIFRSSEISTSYLGWNFTCNYTEAKHNVYSNNPRKYTGFTAIGPSFKFDYNLPFGNDKVKLEFLATSSLLSYIIRPSVSAWEPIGYGDKVKNNSFELFAGGKIKTINKFQRIYTGVYMNYFLHDNFAFFISYSWDFVHYKNEDELYNAKHNLIAGIFLKL